MRPEECMFFNLAKASKKVGRYWKTAVAPLGVTGVQAMVMNFLLDMEGCTPTELKEKSFLDSATLTGILDRLTAMELVERRQNKTDRRAWTIHFTTKGRNTARKVRKRVAETNKEYLQHFSAEQISELKMLLQQV